IPEPKTKPTRAKPALELPPFQPVTRDFAFVVERGVKAGDLVRAAQNVERKLITNVTVFDVYEGQGIEPGKKSIAIAVKLLLREQPADKPRVRNLMKDERIARSMYQRELLQQFVKFLVSRLRFARASRSYGVSYPSDLQPSASLAQPRGA